MYDRVLIPLDGSPFAEEIVPYGVGIARSAGASVLLLRSVRDESNLAAAEEYVSGLARRLGAEGKVTGPSAHPARTIVSELEHEPDTLVAMTTHGRTGLMGSILGSVALSVLQGAARPVMVYRPRGGGHAVDIGGTVETSTVVVPLDGSGFSERILPHAAEMATAMKVTITLVQVLPEEFTGPPLAPRADVLERTYIRGWAAKIKTEYAIEADWDVLHGQPADAICQYLNGRPDVVLAMSSHARPRLQETVFGSVTRGCVRRAGVPILVWTAKA